MTRLVLKWMALVFLLMAAPLSAAESSSDKVIGFTVTPQIYHHVYSEPGVMENRGWFAGLGYALTYEDRIFASLEGIAAYGNVDYSSPASGSIDDKDNICADTRLLLGYAVYDNGQLTLIPYAGIAFRYLRDDMAGRVSTAGDSGYLRESNYLYSPVGLRLSYAFENGWIVSPYAEYDYFWSGKQKSHLGSIAGYEDVENDQNDGHGFRAALSLERQMKRFILGLEVFFRFWDIDRSEIDRDSQGRGWREPANETREIGAGLRFRF